MITDRLKKNVVFRGSRRIETIIYKDVSKSYFHMSSLLYFALSQFLHVCKSKALCE